MKKIILALVVLVLVVLVGSVVYFSFFVKDESKHAEVVVASDNNTETVVKDETEENQVLKSGSFNKIDPLHYASGQVWVEKFGENYKLKFQENFSSADGPDLYVYLSEPQDFKNRAIGGLDTKKTINLGLLKKLSGTQEYIVSKNDFEKYNGAVVIWCKQFGVQFSRAELK